MKVIIAVILFIGSAAALGSGPYLPSGWRPQGPAFYLPTETQTKLADNPEKITIFQENEASGSDSLREYGPPKLQEVATFGNQGLPDIVTDQIFQTFDISLNKEIGAEQNTENGAFVEEKSVVVENVATVEPNIEVEKEVLVNSEVEKVLVTQSTAEELVTVTQKVSVDDAAVTETAGNEEIASTESIVLRENENLVLSEPEFNGRSLNFNIQTDLEETTQKISDAVESSFVTLKELDTTERVIELEQRNEERVISPELNSGTEKVEVTTLPTVIEDNVVVVSVENQINPDTILEEKSEQVNNVEENLATKVTTDIKEIENVAVKGVKNIAEALVKLENEIGAEQVANEEQVVQEISGSLERAPEGFLEYGPPGFKEYGPPKGDDLVRVLDQDIIDPSTVATNELRRRRFSPKFRSTQKNH